MSESEPKRQIWGDAEIENALTDRQRQLVEHYQNLGDLEPTNWDLRRISSRDRQKERNLQRLQAEAAKQDKQSIENAWAELAPVDSDSPDALIFSDKEGKA